MFHIYSILIGCERMTRKNSILLLLILLCFAIAGCAAAPAGATRPSGAETMPTVADLFTQPVESTEPEPASTVPAGEIVLGGISHGFRGEPSQDDAGLYYRYEGGEMRFPYSIDASGGLTQAGIGILLFVDGQPQPYKTAEDEDYRYLHTFYSKKNFITEEFIFTPVTGQAGDMLEIYAVNINYPDWSPSKEAFGFAHTMGMIWAGMRLQYQASPAPAVLPETAARLLACEKRYVDLTEDEIRGWSSQDLQQEVAWKFLVNGHGDAGTAAITGITPEDPLELYFEILGSPYAQFGLVVYLNNEPVFLDGENALYLDIQSGKKTVVEAQVDMAGFDGEGVVYAILVPRNFCSESLLGTSCGLTGSKTFYLQGIAD